METTIKGIFSARHEVEVAIEHLVQEYGIERTDIFVEPIGEQNSSGDPPGRARTAVGNSAEQADASSGAYAGQLLVSVDMNDDEREAVEAAFRDAGALEVNVA